MVLTIFILVKTVPNSLPIVSTYLYTYLILRLQRETHFLDFVHAVLYLLGNPRVLCKAVVGGVQDCAGDPSLQNSLQMAMRGLQYVSVTSTT